MVKRGRDWEKMILILTTIIYLFFVIHLYNF